MRIVVSDPVPIPATKPAVVIRVPEFRPPQTVARVVPHDYLFARWDPLPPVERPEVDHEGFCMQTVLGSLVYSIKNFDYFEQLSVVFVMPPRADDSMVAAVRESVQNMWWDVRCTRAEPDLSEFDKVIDFHSPFFMASAPIVSLYAQILQPDTEYTMRAQDGTLLLAAYIPNPGRTQEVPLVLPPPDETGAPLLKHYVLDDDDLATEDDMRRYFGDDVEITPFLKRIFVVHWHYFHQSHVVYIYGDDLRDDFFPLRVPRTPPRAEGKRHHHFCWSSSSSSLSVNTTSMA